MSAADLVSDGRATLGIELGSTRIKACLVGEDPHDVLAVGVHAWENEFVDGIWTYALDAVHEGLRLAYADLVRDVQGRYGVVPTAFAAMGVSAMMHGYLAFDTAGRQLVPFRTWRNTSTRVASAQLGDALGLDIPLRWSIAHVHQAVLDEEAHVPELDAVTTLAGYVHERLTGRRVLGIGDASGMFPIDTARGDYDAAALDAYERLAAGQLPRPLRHLLPEVLPAGRPAGVLTAAGAVLLDPSGTLRPGVPLCPPEGDAGTGMVATNAITPRTANVSVGTSVFAMVVLDRPLTARHEELDLVTTPDGEPVAMVHCNNGASELAAWVGLFARFASAAGLALEPDVAFAVLLREALDGDADAGGLLAYNHLAGEPVVGLDEGRPLFVRTPDSSFTLANTVRAQLYGVFAGLAIGMRVLTDEGVTLERVLAHGGLFRTEGVAQRTLAAALEAPVAVSSNASEGGAWGIAVLASYLAHAQRTSLRDYLDDVFRATATNVVDPDAGDAAGFGSYLERYRAGLAVEAAATRALPITDRPKGAA
ncbi:ATPase [Pseudoclavibacter chungangensis]|uniref:ATPase n=1 Tax=Pseudoclavibacter chungangensis TaxID=587635 RepID=A0A7J5BP12_9MICO|nr:FGGY-family carbohydrate kinase [Pseudoclavibacter chungangensis]KAB1653624.1 ATPase [Pseudoclavibacter chungangensis]NYJ68735.1 sugar (pentulose or hexulose) kinase [Pseudoclavibacter chungangensis]